MKDVLAAALLGLLLSVAMCLTVAQAQGIPAAADAPPAAPAVARPAPPPSAGQPPPQRRAPTAEEVQAGAVQSIALLLSQIYFGAVGLWGAYLAAFLSKAALRSLKTHAVYPNLVRAAVGISAAALGALGWKFGGPLAGSSAVLGALAAPIVHDLVDAARSVASKSDTSRGS